METMDYRALGEPNHLQGNAELSPKSRRHRPTQWLTHELLQTFHLRTDRLTPTTLTPKSRISMNGLRKATCNPKIKNPYFSRSRGHQPAPGRMVYSANPIASKFIVKLLHPQSTFKASEAASSRLAAYTYAYGG